MDSFSVLLNFFILFYFNYNYIFIITKKKKIMQIIKFVNKNVQITFYFHNFKFHQIKFFFFF